jgi:hypothetical protein
MSCFMTLKIMLTILTMRSDEFKNININDVYQIKRDLFELKKKIEEAERDVDELLGPYKIKSRAVKARKKLREIRRQLLPDIEKKILKQKQDYESDYS